MCGVAWNAAPLSSQAGSPMLDICRKGGVTRFVDVAGFVAVRGQCACGAMSGDVRAGASVHACGRRCHSTTSCRAIGEAASDREGSQLLAKCDRCCVVSPDAASPRFVRETSRSKDQSEWVLDFLCSPRAALVRLTIGFVRAANGVTRRVIFFHGWAARYEFRFRISTGRFLELVRFSGGVGKRDASIGVAFPPCLRAV